MGQLYSLIRNIDVPHFYRLNRETGEMHSQTKVLPARFVVRWPGGKPCVYVEAYLEARSRTLKIRVDDGGSLRAEAAALSQFARFCGHANLEFGALTHDDISEFRRHLLEQRRANNTTINKSVSRVIGFLKWFQVNVGFDIPLVGVPTTDFQPQIRLIRVSARGSNGKVYESEVFDTPLTRATPETEIPISAREIRKLWDAVEQRAVEAKLSRKFHSRFSPAERLEHAQYLRSRRQLELEIMEAIGCRPGELATETVTWATNSSNSYQLVIPTFKRGSSKNGEHLRKVPVSRALTVRIDTFVFEHRAKLIVRLRRHGVAVLDNDALLLNADNGRPLTRTAMRKEFSRLRNHAGIEEKLCFRMFRHRFITNMVKIHLKEYLNNTAGATYASILRSDIRTILTRVMAFTGHKDPESLMAYVHLAIEELGVFSTVDRDVARLSLLRDALRSLLALRSELAAEASHWNKSQILDRLRASLSEICRDLETGLAT